MDGSLGSIGNALRIPVIVVPIALVFRKSVSVESLECNAFRRYFILIRDFPSMSMQETGEETLAAIRRFEGFPPEWIALLDCCGPDTKTSVVPLSRDRR
jgi:hypothetical protein